MKAIIYARVSSVTDRQNTERQVADLTAYALGMNLELVKVFEEKISGAKRNSERPVLMEALDFAIANRIDTILVSELSRLGRNTLEVIETCKRLIDSRVNVFMQKEQMNLLDSEGKVGIFTPIMLATLGTCAQLERENIKFRLDSGYRQHLSKGGKVGRSKGSVKSKDDLRVKYKGVIKDLRAGISERKVAKLHDVSLNTVTRIKAMFREEIVK